MSLWGIVALLVLIVVVLSAAKGSVRFNVSEIEDLEAELRPVTDAAVARGARGKVEKESWSDGSEELEGYVRGLQLDDGAEVEFVLAGVVLARVEVRGGRARLDFDSRRGDDVPPVAEGQRLEVRHEGTVLLGGTFRPD